MIASLLFLLVAAQDPPPPPSPSPSPSAADVKSLFPEAPAPPLAPAPAPDPPALVEGIALGSASIQPAVVFSLIRGDVFPNVVADRPRKVRDTHFQIEPRLGVELPLSTGGGIRASYEPAFRTGSDLAEVTEPSHRLSGSVELPVGPSLTLRAADRWSKGVLDVTQVDPGQEYFFRLEPYTSNVFDVNGRLEGSATSLDAGVTLSRVSIEPGSGFFSHRSRSLYAGIARDLAATLRLRLGYANENVPRLAERPEAQSRSNIYTATLDGAIAPLIDGQISVGYRDQKAPNAGPGGQRFTGVIVAGRIEKEFTRSIRLAVWGSRDTRVDLLRRGGLYPRTDGLPEIALPTLSGFERNAFYVTKAVNTELLFPLPLQISGRGGVQWQSNAYRVVSDTIGSPRQDDFFGWSVGLGRPVTRHAWMRVDYRRDRRNSNINFLDVNTEALIVQLGIGYQGRRGRPALFGSEDR